MATRGFFGRQLAPETAARLPPGQHLTDDFPVLSAGPTPRVRTETWSFTLKLGPRPVKSWNWAEFNTLPQNHFQRDIHCVTTWSKFDTNWEGVLVDDILTAAGVEATTAYTLAHGYDGYTTNVPFADLTDGNLGEGGETVLAFSNPLYVDVDGNGWSAPGVRLTPP